MSKREILIILATIFIIVAALYQSNKNVSASKPSYLCDNQTNCNSINSKKIPKGVCAPGGFCSS